MVVTHLLCLTTGKILISVDLQDGLITRLHLKQLAGVNTQDERVSKQGFIYLHRKLKSHWIFQESDYLKTWIHLLFDAAYEDGSMLVGKQIVQLKRGQLVFGRKAYGAKIGLSEGRLRRFLNLLKSEGMIDQQTTNKFSIISIINYDDYQTHDKQTTNKQLSNDKQTTTNNKYCLLYTSPSPRDGLLSRMPSSA